MGTRDEKRPLRAGVRFEKLDAEAERAMRGFLYALDEWKRARSVFIYVSVPPEPDTREIIRRAITEGKTVAVPKCARGGEMRALVINDLSELKSGMLGIPEPPEDAYELLKPDIAVIPCLACDVRGCRLGRGGGYYDRYLARTECFSACLCAQSRIFESVFPEAHDVRPDMIITECGVLGV